MSWNIQWGVGVVPPGNRSVNLVAIAEVIRQVGPDIVCLQEVARHFPANTGAEDDQCRQLSALLPGYQGVFGPATDYIGDAGQRRQFGNLTLSRHGILSARRHSLPMPHDPLAKLPSARGAVESMVAVAGWGRIGVINAHLEYSSLLQRERQLQALADLVGERLAGAAATGCPAPAGFPPSEGPFTPVTPAPVSDMWILAGDFNCAPERGELACLALVPLCDAWSCLVPGLPPAPTLGVHICPPGMQPQSFDRAYLSPAVAAKVKYCEVLADVTASDHQPLIVEFV